MKRIALLAPVLLLSIATRDVKAQGFVSPFIGTTITSPTSTGSSTKPGFGVAFGGLGKFVGGETEIAFYPEIIDNSANALAKNRVISISGGMLIGPTIGRVKPYVAIGAGDLHLNVTGVSSVLIPNPTTISNDYFTFDAGGGVIGFATKHLGLRGDLRYFRAFGIKLEDLEGAGLSLNHFNFWRASFGVVAKF